MAAAYARTIEIMFQQSSHALLSYEQLRLSHHPTFRSRSPLSACVITRPPCSNSFSALLTNLAPPFETTPLLTTIATFFQFTTYALVISLKSWFR
jgi:hypothetical protein